jgi:NAD kinase
VRFEGISATGDNHAVFASIDGEAGIEFKRGESAVIRKSALRLDLINVDGRNFHTAVSNKLMKPLK